MIATGHALHRPSAPPLLYESRPESVDPKLGQQERLVRFEVCDPLPLNYGPSEHIHSHVIVFSTENYPNGCRCGQLVQ